MPATLAPPKRFAQGVPARLPAARKTPARASSLYSNFPSIRRAGRRLASYLVPDLRAVSFAQEDAADNERDGGHAHRIVQACINIACRGADGKANEREQSSKDAVADVVRQRERGVAN